MFKKICLANISKSQLDRLCSAIFFSDLRYLYSVSAKVMLFAFSMFVQLVVAEHLLCGLMRIWWRSPPLLVA